jgi:hypothetical protein
VNLERRTGRGDVHRRAQPPVRANFSRNREADATFAPAKGTIGREGYGLTALEGCGLTALEGCGLTALEGCGLTALEGYGLSGLEVYQGKCNVAGSSNSDFRSCFWRGRGMPRPYEKQGFVFVGARHVSPNASEAKVKPVPRSITTLRLSCEVYELSPLEVDKLSTLEVHA